MASDSAPGGDWASAAQKAQADLLRQWTDMSLAWSKSVQGATAQPAPPPIPTGLPPAGGDVAQTFLQQCEQYLGISRSLWELMGRASAVADPDQRTQAFTAGLGAMQQQFAGLWAATPFGASPAAAANPFGMGAGFPGLGGAFSMPALGPGREAQESMQRLGHLGTRYWQAQSQVSTQWNDIISRSLRELGERLAPRIKSGAPPGSMKEVYDLWVESAENVYAQAARGAAFVQAQAELTNSLSQLRSAQRELIEEWARQFDLPTRSELNSVHQQLRELKAALQRSKG
jgi:class III poly(R)-hydroxyalkanoic acid synthase PhaE subunit